MSLLKLDILKNSMNDWDAIVITLPDGREAVCRIIMTTPRKIVTEWIADTDVGIRRVPRELPTRRGNSGS